MLGSDLVFRPPSTANIFFHNELIFHIRPWDLENWVSLAICQNSQCWALLACHEHRTLAETIGHAFYLISTSLVTVIFVQSLGDIPPVRVLAMQA